MFGRQLCLSLSFAAPFLAVAAAAAVSYPIPSIAPKTAAGLDPAPVGASFEFFMWPSYMTNITPPMQCLDHFANLYGRKMPIRIGGTTQDRATYDPDFDGYVLYHVDDPLDAPLTLSFGPKFFDLIKTFGTETIIGFNRGDNNMTNAFEAALMAKSKASKFIRGVELGNEPDFYYLLWHKPVAVPPWNDSQEGANAAEWAQAFIDVWKKPSPILVGGVYAVPFLVEPDWPSTNYLIDEAYNESVKAATKVYNTHLYSSGNGSLNVDMNHVRTVMDVSNFTDKIETAREVNRPYIIGETGFHAHDVDADATFGGALQVLDKALWALSLGIQRLFYHQGTINQAFFNWWSDNQVNAPFYGGYMAALALAGGDSIIASDSGNDSYAQYIIYKAGTPCKVVLINTDYYSGDGNRTKATFTLTGLADGKVKALRMTAPSSDAIISPGSIAQELTIGGQYFSNANCSVHGKQIFERASVYGGKVTLELAASEVLLVYL